MVHSSRVWKSEIGGGGVAVCQHGRVRTLLWVPDMSLCPHVDEEMGSGASCIKILSLLVKGPIFMT